MEGKRNEDLKILAHQTVISFSSPSSLLSSRASDADVYLKISLYVYIFIFKVSKSNHDNYNTY